MSNITVNITLTFEGWQYFEELKRGATKNPKVFMTMKYGDEQLGKIVDNVFKPPVSETGFELYKPVDKPKACPILC